jgi:hypothetical protein
LHDADGSSPDMDPASQEEHDTMTESTIFKEREREQRTMQNRHEQ